MVKHGVWKSQLVQVSESEMSHVRGEEESSQWRRPGLVSCDLKFLLISALRWALCSLMLPRGVVEPSQMAAHGFPYCLLLIAHRGMNPTWSAPAGDYRQITARSSPALWLHRKRDRDVMAAAPFPGESSAVPWGSAHTFALSLADCCPWWSHQDFSCLVQFLSNSRNWMWGLRESRNTKGFWQVQIDP